MVVAAASATTTTNNSTTTTIIADWQTWADRCCSILLLSFIFLPPLFCFFLHLLVFSSKPNIIILGMEWRWLSVFMPNAHCTCTCTHTIHTSIFLLQGYFWLWLLLCFRFVSCFFSAFPVLEFTQFYCYFLVVVLRPTHHRQRLFWTMSSVEASQNINWNPIFLSQRRNRCNYVLCLHLCFYWDYSDWIFSSEEFLSIKETSESALLITLQ